MPDFSPLVDRVAGKGADGWTIHSLATAAKAAGEHVIVLSVGDPDFGTPEGIVDRAIEALDAQDTHYTPIVGRAHLRSAIAGYVGRLTNRRYAVSNVMVTAGTQNALFASSLALLGPGDEVIVADPAYLTYEASLQVGGASLVPVALDAAFRLDAAGIRAALTPATKAIMINSPANPTGIVASAEELQAVAELAIEHDLWVISDEVYAELVFADPTDPGHGHCSIAAMPGMKERTVIVGGLSKSHAMTGWRVGWAVGPSALVEHLGKVALCMNYGLPGFVQEAATTAIEQHAADVSAMRTIFKRRRDLTTFMLGDAPGIEVMTPDAGMFVFADVRGTGLSSHRFVELLFAEQKVSVLNGANFGPHADGWVRISITIDDVELAEGCRRIVDFCHTPR